MPYSSYTGPRPRATYVSLKETLVGASSGPISVESYPLFNITVAASYFSK